MASDKTKRSPESIKHVSMYINGDKKYIEVEIIIYYVQGHSQRTAERAGHRVR